MKIGPLIHKLRKERKMTLAELSAKSGVALASLSRIENGRMTGTIESHIAICAALEINLPDLYKDLDDAKKTVDVQTKDSRANTFVHDRKSAIEILTSQAMQKKMMPVLIRIGKGGTTHKEETKVGVEKFIFVLDGKLEAYIGDKKHSLSKGDTLYFESSLPHHFKNIGAGESRLICVVCPPVL